MTVLTAFDSSQTLEKGMLSIRSGMILCLTPSLLVRTPNKSLPMYSGKELTLNVDS